MSARRQLQGIFGLSDTTRDPVIRVHIRRGDYVALAQTAETSWYQRAVARALESRPGPVEVISDDPEWCGSVLRLPVPFEVRTYGSVLADFDALARADVLVATGSTYSWWAAFLGRPHVVHGHQVLPPTLWSATEGVLVV
ncbi:MAG: alpha-1,2-fucosyltransferase [Micrococcales bacterium]|nr:alpha-1,2-fucosyltransferase [Micrococcales bacterium]